MPRFYRIETQDVIRTITDIPDELLIKKKFKRYNETIIDVSDTEELPENVIEETELDYNITKYRHFHIPTLDDLKKAKKEDVKEWYNTELTQSGFECSNGIKLDCREQDKINWLTLKLRCQISEETAMHTIKDYNNIIHEVNNSDVIVMLGELETHYENMLYKKWAYETQINNFTTEEELNSLVIE